METMNNSRLYTRVVAVILAITTGLLLTISITLANSTPNFEDSYKTGPQFANQNDVITYTIVAINTGDLAEGVILSDSLPVGVTYIPGSCTWVRPEGALQPCGPLDYMWERSLNTGQRITTTFAVTVTAGTLKWPMVNHAFLAYESTILTMSCETTANPYPYNLYIPIIAKNFILK